MSRTGRPRVALPIRLAACHYRLHPHRRSLPLAHRHLERQFGPPAAPHLLDYLKEVEPGRAVPAGDQVPRRGVSARRRSRTSATMSRRTGRRRSTASRSSPSAPSRSRAACPATMTTPQSRYIEAVIPTGERRGAASPASICRTAIRRAREKYPYKLAFMERLIRHARKLLDYEEPLVLAGDFNVIPEPLRRRPSRALGHRRAVPAADPGEVPRADRAWLHRRAARDHRRGRPLHVLGLSGGRLAEEQRHPHRPSPAVAAGGRSPRSRPRSTRRCAGATKPPITRRSGSNSMHNQLHASDGVLAPYWYL